MGWNGTWKTKGRPSEARLKFFDETFLQKSFDLALDLHRRAAQERKLGKQRSVFPDRRSASAVDSRLGVLVPSGDRPEPTEPAGETLAVARAHQEANARARRGQVALSVMPLACHLPQRGRRDLAPPLGAATSRWDVAQRPVSAAASVGAGRLPLADSTRGGSRDAGTAQP